MKLCFALLWGSLGWAQLQTNSIEITVTQVATAVPVPDQVSFSVTARSGFDTTLADVVSALSPAGITAANFVGFASFFEFVLNPNYPLSWDFALTVPLSRLAATTKQLSALAVTTTGLSISFNFQGASTSSAGQPACAISDLVADASAQARSLADSSNLRLGPVLAISDVPVGSIVINIVLPSVTYYALTGQPNCAAKVKFGIVRL